MKHFLLFLFITFGTFSFSQEYTDTLYFKSGMVRSAHITKQVGNTIYYDYVNAKGKVISTSVNVGKLKSIQGTNSTAEESVKLKPRRDSIQSYQSNIAFNPAAPLLFGFNAQYLSRFGKNYRHCLYIPFRVSTYLSSTFYLEAGAGYAYVLEQNVNMTFLLAMTPTFFYANDESGGGLMVTFNGIKNITPRVTLNGSIGGGPAIVPGIWGGPMWFTASVGLGFNIGNNKIINE